MRIAIVHPFAWPDVRRGGERYAHDLSWWLTGQGHQVDYLTGGPAHSVQLVDGVRVVRLHHPHGPRLTGWGLSKAETFGATVLPWLVRHRYDVVHALIPSATVAARITGHRTVFTTIGHPVEALRSGGRNRSVLRTGLRAGHVATALSRSAAAAATEVADREVREMNPGLRTEVFTPASAPPAGPPRLLFAAHAGEQRKRLPLLLDAMPRVLDALPGARLIVGGGGDLPDGVPPRVADAADVVGPGALADLPDRYRLATLTVLPSVDEAFGLVLVESLGCGRPVVGADSGGIPEIVTERVGRLARPDDPRALADAIIETATLAAEPDTVRRCAEHAVRWSWDVVGPAHLAAYQDALR